MLDLKPLSGAPSLYLEVVGILSQEGSRNPKRHKCIKKTHEAIILNLSGKTKLNGIMEMGDRVLVGCFPRKRMSSEELKNWTKFNFEPVVGASPCTLILVKEWLVWVFRLTEEVKKYCTTLEVGISILVLEEMEYRV
jgi:hypothetical protein